MIHKQKDMPLIALPYTKKDLALPNELVIDYETGDFYVADSEGNVEDSIVDGIVANIKNGQLTDDTLHDHMNFGMSIDMSDSDPESAEYTDDCTDFTPLTLNGKSGLCNYGSWKKIIDKIIGAVPVLMEDGEEVLYINPHNYNNALDIKYDNPKSILGFEVNMKTGEVVYTNDAVDMQPIKIINGKIDYGDFKTVIRDYFGIKTTSINPEGDVGYDVDPNHTDLKISQDKIDTADNIMVRFKHMYYYYKFTDDIFEFAITGYNPNPMIYKDDIFDGKDYMYIGVYEPSKENDLYVSKADKEPYLNSFIGDDNFEEKYMYIACLSILVSKSVSPDVLGYKQGISYGGITGAMKDNKSFSATNNSIKAFGIENLLGNGVYLSNSIYADGTIVNLEIDSELLDNADDILELEGHVLTIRDANMKKSRSNSSYKKSYGINNNIINMNLSNKLFI